MTDSVKITSADHLYGLVWDGTTGELIANNGVPKTAVSPPKVVSQGVADHGIGLWLSDPGNLAQWLPAGRAAVDAQSAGGLGIQNVNRGFLNLVGGSSDYVISGAGEVDGTNLAGSVMCTGRPVLVLATFTFTLNAGTTIFVVDFLMDGVSLTGTPNGVAYWATAGSATMPAFYVATPQAGPHRFSLWANTGGGTTTITSTSTKPRMIVVEL